ncbi:MAG: hypothetical protein CVU48_04550 [Candidatus Cloacimonetes bacterium HGW-Cloacimonetes-1]|jgi:endonuclease/exonuclease/phosphatase family metal-dependent hydrolase|nr:MAG: hypothetical protein CVU48_04550 [Candidatus Cloacimonetes bacterium HGW-Cloacimonetes-1]
MNFRKHIAVVFVALLIMFGCGTNTNIDPIVDDYTIEVGTSQSLDIVTWNLYNFPAINNSTVQALAFIIPQMKVDIFAFQEINNLGALQTLAEALPNYEWCSTGFGGSMPQNLAFLYNTNTVTVNGAYTIFNNEYAFPRAPYVLDFTWSDQHCYVINNHLKAFGDNYIDETNIRDEEMRRRSACDKLDQYITQNLNNSKVIVVGDMNDQIQEPMTTNVFRAFINKTDEYVFADMPIAQNLNYNNASYPGSLSHLDHILITNELFDALRQSGFYTRTIQIERSMGGMSNYKTQISDHRPVVIRLNFNN